MNHSGAVTSFAQLLGSSPSRAFDNPFQVTSSTERQALALIQRGMDQVQEREILANDLLRENSRKRAVADLVAGGLGARRMASPQETMTAVQQLRGSSGLGDTIQGFNGLIRGLTDSGVLTRGFAGRTIAAGTAGMGLLSDS